MATKGYNLEQTGEQVQAALNKAINLGPATEEADGLMTATDKASLEHLNSVIDTKVDKVTGKGLSTNDFTNEDKSKLDTAYQVPSTGIPAADMSSGVQTSLGKANSAVQPADLVPITEKIPAQASAQNQLADKAFVNSSISTASADFKGTYDSLAELQAVTADKNDYGYVVSTDEAGNTVYSRYKYNGSSWVFEYDLNNSSFTAAEWAAIQSGITAPLVQKLGALPTNADLQSALSGKQATLVSGTNIKTVDGQSILGSGNLSVSDPNAVKVTAQTWTDAQKTQARTNIGAYAKPSGGIPKTDLASGVQGSLDLADSAIQARPSGEVDPTITPAEYATQEELAQLEAKLYQLPEAEFENTYNLVANTTLTQAGSVFPVDIKSGKQYKLKLTGDAEKITLVTGVYSCDENGDNRTIVQSNPVLGTEYTLTAGTDISYFCLYVHYSRILADTTLVVNVVAEQTPGDIVSLRARQNEVEDTLSKFPFVNVNQENNELTPYSSVYIARSATPASKRVNGLIISYLTDDGWTTEQYQNNDATFSSDRNFTKLIRESDIKFVDNFVAKGIVKELYLTGIDDISLYKSVVYQKNHNFWGIQLFRIADSALVAEYLVNQEDAPEDGVYEIVQKNNSGISGYVYLHYEGNDAVALTSYLYSPALFIGNSPAILDYLTRRELNEKIDGGKNVFVSLPDKIYAVVGDTLQLFFRGIVRAVNPYGYDIQVKCAKGVRYARYFEYTPVAGDVGTVDFQINILDNFGNVVGTATCDLVTVPAPSSPASAKKVLCFGDSLTESVTAVVNHGAWCAEAERRLTGTGGTPSGKGLTNIAFCGSLHNGTTGYFGAGGWTWQSYLGAGSPAFRFQVSGVTSVSFGSVYQNNGHQYTVREVNITEGSGTILCYVSSSSDTPEASGTLTKVSGSGDGTIAFSDANFDSQNPLWDMDNNKMSFIPYANEYSNGQIDAVYVLLGWNGISPFKTDFASIIANVKTFADTLHSEFPSAKLKILGIQAPNQHDMHGYGANGGYSDMYGMTYTVMMFNKAYQDFANQQGYSSWVEFVNVSSQFDSENNMQNTTKAVNIRNTETEMVCSNGVHPAMTGYMQIADVVYRNIVAEFCQS